MDEQSINQNETVLTNEPAVPSGSGESVPDMTAVQKGKGPFVPDRLDSYFALFAFVLGFFFARWVLFSWQGWGVTVFTLAFCGSVTLYLLKKGVHIDKYGWFWLAVVVLLGLSFGLWSNNGLAPLHGLILFGSALYWILSATGLLIMVKTSNVFVLDGYNALLVIPFGNFGCQYKSLALLGVNKPRRGRHLFSILLGLFLAFIVAVMVFPLLMQADSGGFAKIVDRIMAGFRGIGEEFWEVLWHALLAIPIAAYMFGLVAGSAHKRGTDRFNIENTEQMVSAWRILPMLTIYILLGFLCLLYIIFIGSQVPYFFSAFTGQLPEGWLVYSEYARRGFFELCSIAAINLVVLTICNVMSQQPSRNSVALKILNSLLALVTLVLIATALSKMALYIETYGLTMRRLLPCVFMIFMAIVCGGIIALQKWSFSITRLAVGTGIVMFCLLCLANPDSLVTRYNADRYLAGTLENFDVEILYRSGPAGVDAALMVYEQTGDNVLQDELKEYLLTQQQRANELAGGHTDTWERAQARNKIAEYFD
ncbi:MAG TPA: DUF4173 domain-containing protein [Syntrophomonadaceae bacterium]|nr:DUF4173 domain-containing protein [Syntrophomonadaceae bacterium]HQE23508.1 DUF4173 domain-containing protein [Syntrophomonadaceae bacterium]